MGLPLLGASHIADPETGRFVSAKHQRVAEIINEWNPDLWLCFIPPENRRPEDVEPFAVVHRPANGMEYIVLTCKEEDVDERLIAKLWASDRTRSGNDVNDYLDKVEAAREALELKEKIERFEEAHDRARSMFHSPKHYYRLSKDKVVRT